MSSNETSEEKTLPPSTKKLTEARRKGRIAHSGEMVTAAVTLAAVGYLLARAPAMASYLRDGLLALPEVYDLPFPQALNMLAGRLGQDALWAVVPLVILIVAVAVLTNVAVNGGLVAAMDPVLPDVKRLNPIDGLKRIFGLRSLIEALKSVVKIVVLGVLTTLVMAWSVGAIVEMPTCGVGCTSAALGALLIRLLLTFTAFMVVLGALDIGLQRWLFRRDMRMTKTEEKRERKDSEGDPIIKRHHQQERRSDGAKTGVRNANFAIRSADIVVAMRYADPDAMVPVLLGRGVGDGFLPLLDDLRSLGVPIVFDAETATLVSSRIRVGGFLQPDLFPPVITCMQAAGLL